MSLPTSAPRVAVLVALMLCAGASHAQQDDKRAAREKEALRRAQQALRGAQEDAARLQAEKAKLEAQSAESRAKAAKETEAAQAQVRGTKGALSKAQAEAQRLTQELEAERAARTQERADYQAKVDALGTRLAQAQRSLAERMEAAQTITSLLDHSVKALEQAEDKNRDLVAMNRKLIGLYRDKGVVAAMAQREPVLGFREVNVENEAEALRTQVEALRLPTGGSGPAPTGAGVR